MTRKPLGRVVVLVIIAMLAGMLAATAVANSQQQAEPAKQAELASCKRAATAELELLAMNVLDGHDVVIKDAHVTIYLPDGEVLASGEFLAGTEACQDGMKGEP